MCSNHIFRNLHSLAQIEDKETKLPFLLDSIERMKQPEKYQKLQAGYSEIDKLLGGFDKETLTLIPARPGIGKTTFVLNLLFNQCVLENNICLFFSLEMPFPQILSRMLCIKEGYKFMDLRDKKTKAHFWKDFEKKDLTASFKNIFFESSYSMSAEEVGRVSKVFIEKFPGKCKAIYVDYLNLLTSESAEKTALKHEKIGAVSFRLKKLAEYLKIPIIALCQGKRDVDKDKKAPTMSDIKDSSNLEADADSILFMTQGEREELNNRQELIVHVLKSRHGVGIGNKISLDLNMENLRIS